MGTLLGALLLLLVLGTSSKHPVNALLIGVAPLTGLFTLIASVLNPTSESPQPLNFETAVHVATSIVAYGAIAYAGTLAILLSWQHSKLKEKPLSPLISALPPLDAMEYLFLRIVQTAWVALTIALITGIFYVEDFWAQQLAQDGVICASLVRYGSHVMAAFSRWWRDSYNAEDGIAAAALLFIGYLGSKAVLEFVL